MNLFGKVHNTRRETDRTILKRHHQSIVSRFTSHVEIPRKLIVLRNKSHGWLIHNTAMIMIHSAAADNWILDGRREVFFFGKGARTCFLRFNGMRLKIRWLQVPLYGNPYR